MLSLPLPAAAQDAVADFYKGKQVAITVGFGLGGSASLYSQVLARHMGRHMPGNPNFVVQHMPGAGGLLVTNNSANNAPRDGTVFTITDRAVPLEPLLGNPNAKFDARKFGWIGNANVEYTTCIAWHTARVKTLADAFTHELVVAGTGAEATAVIFPKAVNKLLGTKIKIVPGYPGSTEIPLAMERGEVEGFCAIGWTFVKLRKRRLAARQEDQRSVPDGPEEASGDSGRSLHPRSRQDAGGSPGLRVPVHAAGVRPRLSSRRPMSRPRGCERCVRHSSGRSRIGRSRRCRQGGASRFNYVAWRRSGSRSSASMPRRRSSSSARAPSPNRRVSMRTETDVL